MDIWVVSKFQLFQVRLLWTFMHSSLYGHMLSLLLGKYLDAQWVDHIIGVHLTFKKWTDCFLLYMEVPVPLESFLCFQILTILKYIVASLCSFNLHFPSDKWY